MKTTRRLLAPALVSLVVLLGLLFLVRHHQAPIQPDALTGPVDAQTAEDYTVSKILEPWIEQIAADQQDITDRKPTVLGFRYPEVLPAGTEIIGRMTDNPEYKTVLETPSHFILINPALRSADMHPYKYVFINEATGETTVKTEYSRPLINGEEFAATLDYESDARFYPDTVTEEDLQYGLIRHTIDEATLKQMDPAYAEELKEEAAYRRAQKIKDFAQSLIPIAHAGDDPRDALPCEDNPGRRVVIISSSDDPTLTWFKNGADAIEASFRRLNFEVHRMDGANYTAGDVLQAIREIGGSLGPCDKFALYVIGHGNVTYMKVKMIGDASLRYKHSRNSNSLPAALLHVRAGLINVMIESCHSGGFHDEIADFEPAKGTRIRAFTSSDAACNSWAMPNGEGEYIGRYSRKISTALDGMNEADFDLDGNGVTTVSELEGAFIEAHDGIIPDPIFSTTPGQLQTLLPSREYGGVLAAEPNSLREGDSGQQTMTFEVTLSAPKREPVTVEYRTQDGNAIAGEDYEETTGTLTFAPGRTCLQVDVPILGDIKIEPDESFGLILENPVGATIRPLDPNNLQLPSELGQGTIENDDGVIITKPEPIAEGDTETGHKQIEFFVTLKTPADVPIEVDYRTVDGTATGGEDYATRSNFVTFAPGERQKIIAIDVFGDTRTEGDETFTVELTKFGPSPLSNINATATILDDDGMRVSVSDEEWTEGDEGDGEAIIFDITVEGQSSLPIIVDYATSAGTATAGTDYVETTGTVTIDPSLNFAKTKLVNLIGDEASEGNETFTITLTNVQGAAIAKGTGLGTIIDDDDDDAVEISVSNAIDVDEGHQGPLQELRFTVELSAPSSQPIAVYYKTSTEEATATADVDFVSTDGMLNFAAGETSKVVKVKVIGDRSPESDEYLFLELPTPPSNGIIVDSKGQGVILNDDEGEIDSGGDDGGHDGGGDGGDPPPREECPENSFDGYCHEACPSGCEVAPGAPSHCFICSGMVEVGPQSLCFDENLQPIPCP